MTLNFDEMIIIFDEMTRINQKLTSLLSDELTNWWWRPDFFDEEFTTYWWWLDLFVDTGHRFHHLRWDSEGGAILKDSDGHTYTVRVQRPNSTTWMCRKRPCPGSVRQQEAVFNPGTAHTHPPPEGKVRSILHSYLFYPDSFAKKRFSLKQSSITKCIFFYFYAFNKSIFIHVRTLWTYFISIEQ